MTPINTCLVWKVALVNELHLILFRLPFELPESFCNRGSVMDDEEICPATLRERFQLITLKKREKKKKKRRRGEAYVCDHWLL